MSSEKFTPAFMEEVFLINLYGTDDEARRFHILIQTIESDDTVVEIAALIEEIRRRHITNMNWMCCDKCQNYRECRINWFRDERCIANTCCSYCQNYENCVSRCKGNPEQ